MKQWFTLKTLVHIVMIAFAGASFSNVRAYLEGAGHHGDGAIILGAALGASLVTVSIMLTHVDRNTDRQAFNLLLTVGCILGALSGSLQAAEYAKHLAWLPSVILGFGIPLGGEVGLAFATSAYTKARERERFRSVSLAVESAVANVLEDAIRAFDPTPIRKHVDRTITMLGRLAVDSAGVQAAQFYARADHPAPDQLDKPNAQIDQVEPSNMPNRTSLEAANDQRKAAKLDGQRAMLDIFRSDPFASWRSVGRQIKRSPSTVSSWINELNGAGIVHNNGNGVEVKGEL